MTKYWPIPPISIALLMVLSFFTVFHTSWLTIVLLAISLCQLFRQYNYEQLLKVFGILLFCIGYFSYCRFNTHHKSLNAPTSISTITIIPDTISVDGDLLTFRGYENKNTYQAYYTLKSQKEKQFFEQTTKPLLLEIDAELSLPEAKRNFNGFDYQAYLSSQGIYRIVKISHIHAIASAKLNSPLDYLRTLRRQWLVDISKKFPNPMKHYMTGLLFGYLGKEFNEIGDLYSQLGIIHLFALSGMQVGFFLTGFRQVLLRIGITQETVNWLQIPFSFCYAALTGFSISVVRSLMQALLQLLNIKGLDNLSIVLISLLMVNPEHVMTAGGVLSFTYAFLICITSTKQTNSIKNTIYQTVILSTGVLPILMWYFAGFQPLSLILTAFFSLLFDNIMLPILTLIFLFSPWFSMSQVNPIFELLELLIKWIASWSGHGLVFGMPSPILFCLIIISLSLVFDNAKRKGKRVVYILMTCLLFALIKHPLENEVTIVDIGQGDSIFIRDITGKTILIDVGGRVDFSVKNNWQKRHREANASRTLIPYLKSRGVHHIDQLILTHTDTDHIGDLEEITKTFDIDAILVSPGSLTQADFVQRLKALQIPVKTIQAGDSLKIMGSQLHVLYPMSVGDGSNDDSIVLYGQLLDKSFLFTGDLEKGGEDSLIQTYPHLTVDILKAGHHGSKGSSSPEFLDHIQPTISLISAGKNNRYQHPHEETLERFKKRDIAIYRTDKEGAIRFRGFNTWHIETVREPGNND